MKIRLCFFYFDLRLTYVFTEETRVKQLGMKFNKTENLLHYRYVLIRINKYLPSVLLYSNYDNVVIGMEMVGPEVGSGKTYCNNDLGKKKLPFVLVQIWQRCHMNGEGGIRDCSGKACCNNDLGKKTYHLFYSKHDNVVIGLERVGPETGSCKTCCNNDDLRKKLTICSSPNMTTLSYEWRGRDQRLHGQSLF